MKSIYNISVFVIICMVGLFASCDEGKIFSQPDLPPKLETTAQESYTVMATLPREIKFGINSNTPWTITSSEPWCRVTPEFSSVSSLIAEITVTAEKNESTAARSAIITISGEEVAGYTITLQQDGKANLEVTKIDETDVFDTNGGEKEFYMVSNKNWTVTPSATWLTVSPESGDGKENEKITIKVTAAPNAANKRTATITVRNGMDEFAFDVTQNGILFEMENTGDVYFTGATETKEFELTANINWSVEIIDGGQWLTVTPARGSSSATLQVSAANNTTLKTRTAQVLIKPEATTIESLVLNILQDTRQDGTTRYDFTQGNQGIYAAPSITFGEKGARIVMPESALNDGWERVRFEDYSDHKKGIYTWKFSSFNIPASSSTFFDLNAWESNAGNFHLFLNANSMNYITSSFGGYKEAYFNNKEIDFSKLETITVILDDDPDNPGKLRLELLFNGEKACEITDINNVYAENPAQRGPGFYYGLMYEGGDDYQGEVVIEYYQQTPIK